MQFIQFGSTIKYSCQKKMPANEKIDNQINSTNQNDNVPSLNCSNIGAIDTSLTSKSLLHKFKTFEYDSFLQFLNPNDSINFREYARQQIHGPLYVIFGCILLFDIASRIPWNAVYN